MEKKEHGKKERKSSAGLKIGTHLSIAKGYEALAKNAVMIGANTFQMFIRNPRGSRAKEWKSGESEAFAELLKIHGFSTFLAHAPYTLNLCSPAPSVRSLSLQMLTEDLQRMESMPGNFYNLHPGNRMDQSIAIAVQQITEALNLVLNTEIKTTILLETMAGKGSEVGRCFEELKAILDGIENRQKIGICMDACHLWDAGYDIVNRLDDVLEQFDCMIGLQYLKAFHINDSMNPLGSHKDRHTTIGDGYIGKETIIKIINHPQLYRLPFILETPTDLQGHKEEIHFFREQLR